MASLTVVIQRGHVPRTSGKTGTGGLDNDPTEQEFAIAAAEAARQRLDRLPGVTVKVIDADVANSSYGGDVFVAIHCDGSTTASAHGASIGWQSPEGKAFGDLWKRAYTDAGWTRGWRQDNYTAALGGYYGVKNAINRGNRVAIICECGFLTNREDEALLTPPGGTNRFAKALDKAVRGYFGIKATDARMDDDEEDDDVAGPRYLIVQGKERGDHWVTDLAVAYPLGGRMDAPADERDEHAKLLVFLGAAKVGPDGKPLVFEQRQLDVIPKVVTPLA